MIPKRPPLPVTQVEIPAGKILRIVPDEYGFASIRIGKSRIVYVQVVAKQ